MNLIKSTLILMLLLSYFTTKAQHTITGKVTDEKGTPLSFVSVTAKGSMIGVNTNETGNYSINIPENIKILNFSFVGYITVEKEVSGHTVINVSMQVENTSLDEVIVIGYGTQRKSDLTGGITSISAEKLDNLPTTNLAQRLQGQVAGLTVSNTNNNPGETSTLRIRGEKSLSGGNNPLIILDGIPFNGAMTEIDQNSVANISILRDASSAAIYGSRAANGVILITTKKGKIGKPIVRYNGYIGIQSVERQPDLMNGPENIQLLKDYRKDVKPTDWDKPEKWLWSSLVDNYKNGIESDWIKETFRTALQQEHQISLSGATESTNYYTSVSYLDQDGVVKNSGYKKYAVTANLSQKLGSWLNVGTNIQLSERDRGGVIPQFGYAYRMSPYASVRDKDGKYIRYPMWTETLYYSPFANQDGIKDDKSRGAYLTGFAEVKLPLEGLTYRANLGYSYRNREIGTYYGSTTMTGEPKNGIAKVTNESWSDWTWENIVRYEKDIKKHHFDLTGLYSAQKTWNSSSSLEGENFLSDENGYHNIEMAQSEKKTIQTDLKETALLSYMGRINYSYAKKYLLTLTMRRDGYSAFGKNDKWATFPSAAGAWVLSEENFFKNLNVDAVNFLKIRASFGANGNQAIDPYTTKTKLVQNDYLYGNENKLAGGLVADFTAGNPNLKWETTYSFNTGIDFSLLKNRLSGSFDLYRTRTKDLLMDRTVPVMNGFTTTKDNVGKTEVKGFEFTLNSLNVDTETFKWNSVFTLSGNWSKIIALKEDNKDDISNKWFIGEAIRVYYDYKVVGIWQKDEAEEAAKYKAVPGDAKLLDKNENGKIDADDRVIIGSKLPVWTLGLSNTFMYKNWTLSIFLNGVFDITKENETVKFERQLLEKNPNYINGIEYWTPERPSNDYTRLGYADTRHNFYTGASFLRIQDVSLSYMFPKNITNKLGIQGLTLYVNGRNLYTFSKAYKYTTNLEQDKYSLDATGYPTTRVMILGVNLTF